MTTLRNDTDARVTAARDVLVEFTRDWSAASLVQRATRILADLPHYEKKPSAKTLVQVAALLLVAIEKQLESEGDR